jgi:hypothetical protein
MSAYDFLCARLWRPFGFASVSLVAACSGGNVGPLVTAITVPAATSGAGDPTVAARDRTCRSNADCSAERATGLCMPKAASKELSDAEDLLQRAVTLANLVTRLADPSSASGMQTIVRQVHEDDLEYGRLKQGGVAPGANAPPTSEEMQHAAWLQSGTTQAEELVVQLAHGLSTAPVTTDAQKVYADITFDDRRLDRLVGDLQTFLHDIELVLDPSKKLIAVRMPDGSEPDLTTGAGATRRYLGPMLETLDGAMSQVRASIDPAAPSQLENDLAVLSQGLDRVGKDGNAGTCLESP